MALEDLTGTNKYLANLVNTNPLAADDRREGDDHIRGIKNVLLNTFGALSGPVNFGAYVLRTGDVMTGPLTYTTLQAALSNGPALIGDGSANYLNMSGLATANWAWQWQKANGSLVWKNSAGNDLLTINGLGDTTAAGNINAGPGGKGFGFQGSLGSFIPQQLVLVGTGTPEVMAQVTASPSGMFQAVQFKHNPGVSASITLNVNGGTWRFTSDQFSFQPSNSASWNVTSDMRVKKDVCPYPYGLPELLKIDPILYRFVDDKQDTPRRPGFDAQGVRDAMPAMLGPLNMDHPRADELGGLLTLQPDYAWFALINAVKTLAERVEALELLCAGVPDA